MEPNNELKDVVFSEQENEDLKFAIDYGSWCNAIVFIGFYTFVILISTYSGIFGPKETYEQNVRRELNKDSLKYQFNGLEPKGNEFILLQMKCELEIPLEIWDHSLINVKSVTVDGNEVVKDKIVQADFAFKNNVLSNDVVLYFEKFVKCSSIAIELEIQKIYENIKYLRISLVTNNNEALNYEIFLRVVFMFVIFSSFIFVIRLKIGKKSLELEHKMTVLLLIFGIIATNPLILYNLFDINQQIKSLTVVCETLFKSFMIFYILVISGKETCGKEHELSLVVKNMFLLIIHFMSGSVSYFAFQSKHRNEFTDYDLYVESIIQKISLYINILLFGLFIIQQIIIFCKIRIFESKLIITRSLIFFSTFLINIYLLVSKYYNILKLPNEGHRFLELSYMFIFPPIMSFINWPYDSKIDQKYQNPESDSHSVGLLAESDN